MSNWFFLYQAKGGEDSWVLSNADDRARIERDIKPAFVTVLDVSTIPDDNDWTKVRYRGCLYFDFDADGDLEKACEQFKHFLLKLNDKLDFDLTQARLYLSGGKGMHVEIPQECFMPKVPPAGTPWLPYVYRAMAESLIVETMDLRVYTGKRGRMWRTTGVKRENGNYKVPISLELAMTITPELYLELVAEPRPPEAVTPPSCNSAFAVLFNNSKEKVTTQMRGKKKRQAAANAFLDPWKKIKKTPPTIQGLMDGSLVADDVGFQSLSMQLAIYAVSVDMELEEFLQNCAGLCENHVSDGNRYNTPAKRREELARMWRYMSENNLYDFETGPIAKLVKRGTVMSDIGQMERSDSGDEKPSAPATESVSESEPGSTPVVDADLHKGLRKGFFMNADGMWKQTGENTESICRATLRNVESFYDVDKETFLGYEFDVVQRGVKTFRTMLSADAFTSAAAMKKFFVNHQIGFQGGDMDVMSLMDLMAEKAKRNGRVYVYPREGFMLLRNPHVDTKELVKVYLTQSTFISSLREDDEAYFRLRYRPTNATSSYNIDIHTAPDLNDDHKAALHDLFSFSRDDVLADIIGWFVAAHYRSVYLELFKQFPLLQIYGEAGSGKSQTVLLLAHLHWHLKAISMKSAASCTPFAVDCHASSSTSAPFILDEYKPRELRLAGKGKYEKLKDMFKASYIGGDIGERGTLNKGAENTLAIIRSQATAPVVFMGEAIEMETAIIERCVTVNLTKQYQTKHRQAAFLRLQSDSECLSALGRALVEVGFTLNLEGMANEVRSIQAEIEAGMPEIEDETARKAAPRMIYNRAVIVHALRILKHTLSKYFGDEFNASIDALLASRIGKDAQRESSAVAVSSMSEVSKVINRIALLSRDQGTVYEMIPDKDYVVGAGWVEIRVERAYDQYRRYCASIHDTPLFDSLDTFIYGLAAYSPVTDRVCASSELRADGSSEKIVRMSLSRLNKEGVGTFRT